MLGEDSVVPGAPTTTGPCHWDSPASQNTHRASAGPCTAISGRSPGPRVKLGEENVEPISPTPKGPCHWASGVSQYIHRLLDGPWATTVGVPVAPLTIAGEERWYGVSQTTFPEGRVLVLRDATEAQALERARSDFVATAAHELRTPIAAIYGAARTLRRRDIELAPATEEQFLGVIESESDRLNRIVGQILTTAQLDRGELSITSAACDLRALCEDVVRSLEIAKPDSITFSLDAPDALAPVDSDAERLRQELTNLVGNAVKYSPDGGNVTVRIVDGLERVRIEVRDEGLGIPRSQQSRIFDKFYRLDPSLSRGVGGSGLGLYICRELIEQMGGSISVSSRPKAGSTFTVELPRRR